MKLQNSDEISFDSGMFAWGRTGELHLDMLAFV